jgi:hypothetical protein
MTPDPAALAAVRRRRLAATRAVLAYREALVAAVDAGHPYRVIAEHAGLSAARVHEVVALERADQARRAREAGA